MTDWNEATLRWLNDFAAQGILVTDAKLNIRGWNNWLETNSGREAAEVVGRNLLEVYPELVERGLERYYRDALAGRISILSHRFHRHLWPMPSDYRPGLMAQSARIAPLVEEGRVIGTITVIEDVTERVERENALRESEEWLNTTLRSIGDAVIATDTEGLVTLMNPVAEDLTGWNEEEAMGRPLGDVFNIVNEHTEEPAKNPVTRALREGIVVGLANHTVLIAKDATRRVIADSAAPIRDPAGNIIGVVMVFRDITERVRAQEALQEYSEWLEEMVEERTTELQEAQERLVRREKLAIMGQLAGGVAHEIRNPLSGISNSEPEPRPRDHHRSIHLRYPREVQAPNFRHLRSPACHRPDFELPYMQQDLANHRAHGMDSGSVYKPVSVTLTGQHGFEG